MDLRTLKVSTRDDVGKGALGRIRRSGEVPLVLYGSDKAPITLKVEMRDFVHLVHGRGGEHAIVQLEVENQPELSGLALLKDVQHHPVRGHVIHADFLRIRLDQRITTLVPVVLTGHAKGVVEGGVLDHQLRELEVECFALEVPTGIPADVSELGLGDSLHVAQLVAPNNVRIVTEPDRTVVAVHVPRVVKVEEVAVEPTEVAEVGKEAAGEEGEDSEEK